MEEYPNGRITEQGFIKIYTQFFTQSNDPSKFAAQVFRMFDENKVGIKLSFMLFYDLFLYHLSINWCLNIKFVMRRIRRSIIYTLHLSLAKEK